MAATAVGRCRTNRRIHRRQLPLTGGSPFASIPGNFRRTIQKERRMRRLGTILVIGWLLLGESGCRWCEPPPQPVCYPPPCYYYPPCRPQACTPPPVVQCVPAPNSPDRVSPNSPNRTWANTSDPSATVSARSRTLREIASAQSPAVIPIPSTSRIPPVIVEGMVYKDLIVLLPCSGLESLTLQRSSSEAEELLAGWSALYHPALIAGAGKTPRWDRMNLRPV